MKQEKLIGMSRKASYSVVVMFLCIGALAMRSDDLNVFLLERG